MQGNRAFTTIKKPKAIFDKKTFPIISTLNTGDKGQALIKGVVIEEEKDPQEDGTELMVKTIKITSFEPIINKSVRI